MKELPNAKIFLPPRHQLLTLDFLLPPYVRQLQQAILKPNVNIRYYMDGSVNGQDETNHTLWLATRAEQFKDTKIDVFCFVFDTTVLKITSLASLRNVLINNITTSSYWKMKLNRK